MAALPAFPAGFGGSRGIPCEVPRASLPADMAGARCPLAIRGEIARIGDMSLLCHHTTSSFREAVPRTASS